MSKQTTIQWDTLQFNFFFFQEYSSLFKDKNNKKE